MKVLRVVLCIVFAVCVAGCSCPSDKPAATEDGDAPATTAKAAVPGMTATASTTQQKYEGEGTAAALVDGDRKTRWASLYKDKQEVVVDMGNEMKLAGVNLYWETAAAKDYSISLSSDGEKWQSAHSSTDGEKGPRTDEVKLDNKSARYIRLELTKRATEWGFSLYEIEPVLAK
jgi:hypothetical protein